MMKKPMSICLFFTVLLMVSAVFAAPKFEAVGDATYKFGTVNQGEEIKHTFEFKNAGDEALKIMSVKGS